jgi:hypothetical protein
MKTKPKTYQQKPEMVFALGAIDKSYIPEVKIKLLKSDRKKFLGSISQSSDVAKFIRSIFKRGELLLREQFIVLYLNRSNTILGYYRHTTGGISSVIADVRLILSAALKSLSSAIIVAHNHPSGNNKPSQADIDLTRKLKDAAKLMDIDVLDHVIVTQDQHYSFADSSLIGIEKDRDSEFVQVMLRDLGRKTKHSKISVEKLASQFGISDKNKVKELTEYAIVLRARKLAHQIGISREQRFHNILELYQTQVNLSHRTSQSILLQQYSTPAPISYLAGVFCLLDEPYTQVFEPSAGNGLLTIAANPSQVVVNEIDYQRNANLKKQGYKLVTNKDATKSFHEYQKQFDAVITNPPFGTLDNEVLYDTFPIKTLDHLMALRALDCMKDNGRAAIIIGNHTNWDEKGRIQAGKNRIFFNYLYSRYTVVDVIQIDGKKLYSRQGTGFNVRLILINGRKEIPQGVAPVFDAYRDKPINSYEALLDRISENIATASKTQNTSTMRSRNLDDLILEANKLKNLFAENELGAPYQPASESCVILNTQVPDSMSSEIQQALERIKEEVGGDVDNFVRHRLGYETKLELCKALSAEQIDAVAMAIFNIEAFGEGMIIGDQTGIGKGRIAASIVRYAVHQGKRPVFLTEKANLFSDLYRDLHAIGSGHLKPFIVNARESKTDIKDEDGNVVYSALAPSEQQGIFQSGRLPANFDFVMATYSQFNSPEKKPEKPNFLMSQAQGNIFILDEAHNSSGSSNTGEFLQRVVSYTKGVVFLSATFAKRPDNMPIYAMKTAISEAAMTKDDLVSAIAKGGVALQEILSSQLVAEGQMIRRERSFEGVEVNYITLSDYEKEHRAIADNVTEIVRDIIAFQTKFVDKMVEELDDIAIAEGKEVELREGTSQAGVDNQPYFSKVFQVINQMLFSIKADAVADRAIARLREGKKPVIAFASTMGSFIEEIETASGLPVGDGEVINADFSEVLRRGLDGILRYTEKDVDGNPVYKKFSLSELPMEAQREYNRIWDKIKKASTGITISPIDVIVQKLTKAGYRVAEVTGRKYEVQINMQTNMGLVMSRKKVNTNDAFRKFNNNEVDVLMINQSGSTGASAHAIVTNKVASSEVKQRVMIVLQAELDINTEVQKRGRINRTGQILKPIYDYVNSAIPAEMRLMMMLQKKLKSLDANTTSNQKQSTKILDVPDFLNKYGDRVVKEYLMENPKINELIGDPLHMLKSKADSGSDEEGSSRETIEDAAHKVSGRIAVLSTAMQQEFYTEISERYQDYVEYLKQINEYDLEVETLNLQTETVTSRTIIAGKGGRSAFGDDSILETVRANVLKKPFTKQELDNLLRESLQNKTSEEIKTELIQTAEQFFEQKVKQDIAENKTKYQLLLEQVPQEKKLLKIKADEGEQAYQKAIAERINELSTAHQQSDDNIVKSSENRKAYLLRMFKFFSVGRFVNYAVEYYDQGQQLIPSVFLGFVVDMKKKNPFAPSAIRLRFAISNSSKYIAIPASYSKDISEIMATSMSVRQHDREALLEVWDNLIQENTISRKVRHIISGNLLQAFSDYKGKLVSYTTLSGETRKGILMPESWSPGEVSSFNVSVPIAKALPIIKSLSGGSVITSGSISLQRYGDGYRIMVPASKAKGGDIYLHPELLKLVNNGNFEKASDKMVASFPFEKIEAVTMILQDRFGVTIEMSEHQFSTLKKDKRSGDFNKKPIELPPPEEEVSDEINLLELEAEALKLMLELLEI